MSEDARTGDAKSDAHRGRPGSARENEVGGGGGIQFSSAVTLQQREVLEQVADALAGGTEPVHEKS